MRHYKLFYRIYAATWSASRLGFWGRLGIALTASETEDDELAYAYYAANHADLPYDRQRWTRAYVGRAYAVYRPVTSSAASPWC